MATLRGWGKEIGFLFNQADHTYVTCDGGHAWPCWGGSSGGRKLCRGPGSSARADCLSQPSSHAGLIYAVTGVCHQTANRILYPAGVTVSNAKGYWASWLLYNTYGTNNVAALAEWLLRIQGCSGSTGEIPDCQPAAAKEMAEPAGDELSGKIIQLYSASLGMIEAGEKLFDQEHALVMEHKLGRAFDREVSGKLLDLRKNFWDRKEKIDSSLKGKIIAGGSYAKEVNAMATELQQEAGKVMGADAFASVFEFSPQEPVNVVDPQIAIAVYGEDEQ